VDVTMTGEGAIRLGCTEKCAVLIAGLCLPEMDGIEVIRRIKDQQPEIVPIVITAYPTEERRLEAKQIGVTYFLEKPFTLKEIRTPVMQALEELDLIGN
jgi:DNA-binding NtrC family response regulator